MSAYDPSLCQYSGKRCSRPRAVKLNGEFHQLCNEHRLQANASQQRLRIRKAQHERARAQQLSIDKMLDEADGLSGLTEEDLKYLLDILDADEMAVAPNAS